MYTTKVRLKTTGLIGTLRYSEEALIKERTSDQVFVRWDGNIDDASVTASSLELLEHEAIGYLKRIIANDKERNIYYLGRGYDLKAYQEAVDILEEHFKIKL